MIAIFILFIALKSCY